MNERIKELAEQAVRWSFITYHETEEQRKDIEREKFAELIVRECARVYWNIDNGELHSEYVNALKQHFGVE